MNKKNNFVNLHRRHSSYKSLKEDPFMNQTVVFIAKKTPKTYILSAFLG